MSSTVSKSDETATGSAARILDVLEYLSRRSHPVPAARIGAACDIPRSSMYNLLRLLKARRYVSYRAADRTWSLGPAASELSTNAPLFVHGLAVLRAFAATSRSLAPREIAGASGLSGAMVDRMLPFLVESDLLHEELDGRYSLGLELVGLASRVGWVDRVRIACRPHLIRLRDATQETANLIVRDGDHALYIDQVESRYALRHSGWVGRRVPLEGTATGAAFADHSHSHIRADAVELGVTAITCAIAITEEEVAVGITAPSWRLTEFGVWRAQSMVEAVAREISERLAR
jgi:DNA-binding IclR family transcriptional regulator